MRIPMMAISTLAMALGLALSACRDNTDLAPADDPTPAATDAGADSTPPPDDALAMASYTCDGDHRVTVDGDTAQVMLADGRTVELPRIAGTSTATFTGEALEFTGDAEGGTLMQDEGGSFTCRAG